MCLGYKSFALLCSIYSPVVASGATFINPPAYPQGGYDLATSPSYGVGSTVDIKWTIEPRRNVSLALFQLSGATSLYPYENLFSMFPFCFQILDMDVEFFVVNPGYDR
jgi:hypothetical protein